MKPFISTTTYGFFNYAVGITLMLSPWLFGMVHVGGASLFLPLLFGWLQIIMAIFGRHKLGLIKVFPVSTHCVLDTIVGFFLMVSPFVYTFTAKANYWPHILLGAFLIFLGIFTKQSPFTDEPHHVMRDGLLGSTEDVY